MNRTCHGPLADGDRPAISDDSDLSDPITDRLEIMGEKTILIAPHLKSVRLDVFVIDENAWYNIEMQCTYEPDPAKRSRCYQSEIDVENLAKGRC